MNPFKKAQWIKHPEGDRENTYCRFFESFEYCENAAFKICCEGNFAAYLNGVLFCFGQYLGYDDLQFYDEYALDGYLKRGNNELFIITHHPGVDTSTYRNGSSGVIYEVISGDNIIAASSEKTRVSFDPNYISGKDVGKVSPQLGFTFAFDMTKNKTDPLTAELSNRKYSFEKRPVERLSILPRPKLALVSNGGFSDTLKDGRAAFVMYNSELSPENSLKNSLLPSESGLKLEGKDDGSYIIADLGEENTGILSLDIELSEESRIIIGWGEHLTDGRVRSFIGGRNFASEIRLPKGRHDLDFPLLRCGLRYIELHVYSKSALLHYIGIKPTLYPVKNIAPCPISGEIHKKIYDVSIRTLHLCMHEHYEDCPWREQALYSMDSRNQMLCGYYAFGEKAFARASIRLMAHSLREDGLIELCSPARVPVNIPSFSAVFIRQLYEYLIYSGDLGFIEEMLPTAAKIADSFIEKTGKNGLIPRLEYWNFYEWQTGLDGYGEKENTVRFDAPLAAFTVMALDSLSKLYDLFDEKKSLYYKERCEAMVSASEIFYDSEIGCYATYIRGEKREHFCELTNSLFLYAGIAPEERRPNIRKKLLCGELIPITLSHSIFKYDALLEDSGNISFVLSDIEKKWGRMLELGATTFWETEEGDSAFDNAGSLCHGWSAVPVYIYHRYKDIIVREK